MIGLFSLHFLSCIKAIDSFSEKKTYLRFDRWYRKKREREYWYRDPLDDIEKVIFELKLSVSTHNMYREKTWNNNGRKENCKYDRACYRNRKCSKRMIDRVENTWNISDKK